MKPTISLLRNGTLPLWVGALLFALVFAADIATTRGVPAGFAYISLIACVALCSRTSMALALAAVGSALITIAGIFKAPGNIDTWMFILNRLVSIGVLWITAAVAHVLHRREATLRQADAELRRIASIVESSDDAVISMSLDGIVQSWNRGAERLFGYSAEEMIGQNIQKLIPDSLKAEEELILGELSRGKFIDHYQTRRIRRDGSKLDISVTASPLYDSAGKLCGASKIARDITRLKQNEAALKEAEERYQLLIKSSSVGVWDWNMVTHDCYWSPRFTQLMGVSDREFTPDHQPFKSRLHPDDRDRVVAQLSAHTRGEAPYDVEYRVHQSDGSYVWIHATGQVAWDDSGKPVRMVGTIVDISARKQAEEQFKLIFRSAPCAMVMADSSGTIVLINSEAERLFGYGSEELRGQQVEMLMPERFRTRHKTYRTRFNQAPIEIQPQARPMGNKAELFGLRKDGSEFAAEIGLIPVQTSQGVMALSAVQDISERKLNEERSRRFSEMLEQEVARRTEQLVAANRELDDFAYAASHDLRAPLRVISNASKWLEEDLRDQLTEETKQDLHLMRTRVNRMEKMLDDLLQYARIGRIEAASIEIVSGDQLLNDVRMMLSCAEGVTIDESKRFADIRVQKMPLQQVLLNLVGNAIKHHDKAEKHIAVTVEEDGEFYRFAVEDDGPGIPAQYHERIFGMFQTLRPRDQVEGSGLGLAIVRKNVQMCGGKLDLVSSEGNGSKFSFTWPKGSAGQPASGIIQ